MAVTTDSDITGIPGGGAAISGTPSSDQLAIWASAAAVRGDASLAVSDNVNFFTLTVSDEKLLGVGASFENTHASGPTSIAVQTGVGGAGDPFMTFGIGGGQTYAIGLDNSVSDEFCIARSNAVGTDNVIRISTTGGIGLFGEAPTAQPAAQADAAGGAFIDAEARTALNGLLAKLRTLGVIDT